MSKIEVDQVDPQSGTTLTLGTSGDTISIPAGVTLAILELLQVLLVLNGNLAL